MKKVVLSGTLRWIIDACILVAMAWGFGWLFGIVTGVIFFLDRLSFLDEIITNSEIFYWGILVFPLLIGLIMSIIFTFISIKFHLSNVNYILICVLIVILPTLPYIKSIIPRLERSGELGILCYAYIALSILLSNFIYQRIKSISYVTSAPS